MRDPESLAAIAKAPADLRDLIVRQLGAALAAAWRLQKAGEKQPQVQENPPIPLDSITERARISEAAS